MINSKHSINLIIAVMLLFAVSPTQANGRGGNNMFNDASKGLHFEKSNRGYGFLVPKNEGSESGIVINRMLGCEELTNNRKKSSFRDWEENEKMNLHFIFSLFLEMPTPHLSIHSKFLNLWQNPYYFYNTKKKYQKKIYSNKNKEWTLISRDLKNLAEKYFHLEQKILPSENIKAVVLLDILKKKKDIQFKSLGISIKNSFFLINRNYITATRTLLMTLLNLDNDGYNELITSEIEFYKLGSFLKKIERKVMKAHKEEKSLEYKKFINFHQDQLTKISQSILQHGHPLISNQAFSEKKASAPSCDIKAIPVQCDGFIKTNNRSTISSFFHLEYFKAWREFEVIESESEYLINLNLKFLKKKDVSTDEFYKKIEQWTKWSTSFYNDNKGYKGKKVHFNINFQESTEPNNQVIHVRRCWNASMNSDDCTLPAQANSKNFTLDMGRDTLLEEVGHYMGLFDEYRTFYYHFNSFGAENSFMVADKNYKIYPEHISRILTPHLTCNSL